MTRSWPHYIGLSLLILITISTFAASRLIPAEIISLPLVTISVVTFLFLVSLTTDRFVPKQSIEFRRPGVVDVTIFLLIGVSAIIGRIAESGVLDWYYPIIIVTSTILALRIAIPPVKPRLHLFQILLVALVVRATPWYSYHVYGQDRFHHTVVEYIIATGNIISRSVTYYADFPDAHRFVASYILITGSPFKTGYFSLGIVVALSILGVYLLADFVLDDEQGALIAALFISVSGYHIKAGAEPFAEALFIGLVPFIIYLLISQNRDWRRMFLLLGLAAFATKIQNIAPLVLSGVSVTFLISGWATEKIHSFAFQEFSIRKFKAPVLVAALVLVVGFYHYILARYLRFQTMRVVSLAQSLSGSSDAAGQDLISDTSVAGVPTVSIFGHELPGVLMWAAPILTGAGILILTAYLLIYIFFQGDREFKQIQYISVSSFIFTIFTLFFISGSPATRALPSVLVLLSPVVGWVIYQTLKKQPTVGQAFTVILILCTVTAGVLTPPVAKAELTNDNFRAYMDSEEVVATEFAIEYTTSAQASNYAVNHEKHIHNSRPNDNSELTLKRTLNKNNQDTLHQYRSGASAGETTVYFRYFGTAYGISEPDTNKIYSSSNASVWT